MAKATEGTSVLHARARDRVFRAIRTALLSGGFHPGERIKIRPLAASLGTSLTPVREALMMLVVAGALENTPNKSIRVPLLSPKEIDELKEARILLEGYAAAAATEHASEDQISTLESISIQIAASKNAFNVDLLKENIVRFHFYLYNISRKEKVVSLIEGLWLQTGPYMNLLTDEYFEKYSRGAELRQLIFQGLREKNPAIVQEALTNDLEAALTFVAEKVRVKTATATDSGLGEPMLQ